MDIQTVKEVDAKSAFTKKTCDIEEPEGFGPEIIGGKIVDPRIDKDEVRFHILFACDESFFQGLYR